MSAATTAAQLVDARAENKRVRMRCSDLRGGPSRAGVGNEAALRPLRCCKSRAVPGYLIAIGLIGEPTARVTGSGGAVKKNSYTLSFAQSAASSRR